jgi:hypothetical protein
VVSGGSVVIRHGSAYPDAVVEQLASEVDATRVRARLEPVDTVPDRPGHLVVEIPAAATLRDVGFVAVWAAVVATARRRRLRQLAEGGGPDVAATLRLLGGIDVVVAPDGTEPDSGRLLTVVAERLRAGTLTAGTWGWDPGVADLARDVR